MRRSCAKACIWCGLAALNYKDCSKPSKKELMRTVAQAMRLHQPVEPSRSKEKTKYKPEVAIREPWDPNRVIGNVIGNENRALIDLETIGRDLIRVQFAFLHTLLVVKIETKALATAVKVC